MDKNFRVRVLVGIGLFVGAVLAIYLFDGVFLRILFAGFSIVAGIELLSFLKKNQKFNNKILLILELGFLFYGVLFAAQIDILQIWYMILGVSGYDVFAYLSYKLWGGKFFKKARPFPHISKNKTWEGTIGGLSASFLLVLGAILIFGNLATDWIFLLCGPLALMGDLYESFLKRRFKVKDSNEIIIKQPFFAKLEVLVGGSNGHGGYLDRIDSLIFTATVLLIVSGILA